MNKHTESEKNDYFYYIIYDPWFLQLRKILLWKYYLNGYMDTELYCEYSKVHSMNTFKYFNY